jgi:hypothetical protein
MKKPEPPKKVIRLPEKKQEKETGMEVHPYEGLLEFWNSDRSGGKVPYHDQQRF